MTDPTAPLLLLVPLPEEAAALRRRLEDRERIAPPGAPLSWRGRLAGRRVVLTVTGDGERRARLGAAQILERLATEGRRPAAVIGFGVAGGLSPELEVGDLVASRRLSSVVDLQTAAGRPPAAVDEEAEPFRPDPDLLAAAVSAGARAGMVLTDRHLADTPERKWELLRRAHISEHHGGEAPERAGGDGGKAILPEAVVDLESTCYARVAEAQGLPWLMLRAVSDTAGESLPAYLEASRDPGGSVRRNRVVLNALARPWTVPALVRMARRVASCSEGLAGCIETALTSGENRLGQELETRAPGDDLISDHTDR